MFLRSDLKHVSNYRDGFTLLEVMVAVVVVGVLAAIAYPSYTESVRRAKRVEGRAALMQLMQQEERFYSQRSSYIKFTVSSTSDDEKRFKWFSGEKAASSAYEIRADACKDDAIQNCVLLTARPGTDNVDKAFKDPVCGELTLTSTGVKGANGSDCWK
jgi:type IV pilus assembly protein PilE